jgi:hypothetical protein
LKKDPIELSLPTRKQQRERQGLINVNSPQNYKTGMTLQDKKLSEMIANRSNNYRVGLARQAKQV